MAIRLPIVWGCILYIIGVMVGHVLPSHLYLFLTLGAIAAVTLLYRRHKQLTDMFILSFWLLLGSARINMTDNSAVTPQILTSIQEKAKKNNELLLHRLKEAGLKDEPLAISSALALGNKAMLSKDLRQTFSRVGASHLLALSGLHLGILYGLLYLLIIRKFRYTKWKWHILPPILICIWGYAWLTGMPVSLLRAAIMLSLLSVASLSQADYSPIHLLAFSALAILLWAPKELFSISFQLSFAAVFFILVLYKPLRRILPRKYSKITEVMLVSAVAQLGTTPLTVYYFHTLPVLSVPLSVLLIPLTSIILYLCLATLLLPLSLLGEILNLTIKAELQIMNACACIPCSSIDGLHHETWQIVLVYVILVCLALRTKSMLED